MADQLQPIPLVTPGFKGLNKAQAASTDLDPGWATDLQNFVFDNSGRIACRNGWAKQTAAAISGTPTISSMGELALANGSVFVVSAAGNKLYSGTTTLTDITGAITPSANNWQWVTFNGAIYGIQQGHPLIKWNGTGNFATITPSSGTVPTGGNSGVAAFGRLWIVGSDSQTIYYCNLLDDTAWSVTGAGSVNMATVWTRGIDQVVGIAAAGSKLVVLGTRQIVIFADSAGAAIGLNPQNIFVYDTIEGTGLAARDTVQSTGEGDLTFLSPTGVQSLQRLLSSGKGNPVAPLDPQVHDYFNSYFVNEDIKTVRSLYSPINRFYLILLPASKRVFCYDTRAKLQDGTLRSAEWNSFTWSSFVNQKSGNILVGEAGVVGLYSGYLDNAATYQVVYNSPYIALNSADPRSSYENHIKILKRWKGVLVYGGNTNFTFFWGVDFQGLPYALQYSLTGTLSEYNIAQYNINEYAGGAGLSILSGPLSSSGRWMQFGMTATINNFTFAIQQLDVFVKIGNMA